MLLTRRVNCHLKVFHSLLLQTWDRMRIQVERRHHRRVTKSLMDHLWVGPCLQQECGM